MIPETSPQTEAERRSERNIKRESTLKTLVRLGLKCWGENAWQFLLLIVIISCV